VEIVEVAPDSPAELAGMRSEDLIVELDGEPVERVDDVQRLMTEATIGQTLSIRVLRGDRTLELRVRPVELGQ
jgi:S1-C subfamily serine protease